MFRFTTAVALALSLTGSGALAGNVNLDHANAVIASLAQELDGIRENIDEADSVPESSRFKRDQTDVHDDLNEILDEIIALVVGDEYRSRRVEVIARDKRIEEAKLQIAELDAEKISARPSPADLSIVDRTLRREFSPGSIEDLQARIAEIQETQAADELANRRTFSDLANDLRSNYGIEISPEQARVLLYQLNGSSIVEAKVGFVVLNRINDRLGELRTEAPNDISRRRYYGMSAALQLLAVRLHEAHLHRYDEEWLPRIEEISARQRDLIASTEKDMSADDDQSHRAAYQNNLRIQERTLEVAEDYRERLERQREFTHERLEKVKNSAKVAINTLKTLESASALAEEMRESADELEALLEIDPSDLIPLGEDEVNDAYLQMSRDLATS